MDGNSTIKYTKLITDSDTDGIFCAAMLLRVFPGLKLYFSSPSDMQDNNLPVEVDECTIISDLPYVNDCGLYFDHHSSNEPKEKINGIWRSAPSAARIIYEYYKDKFPLTDFLEFLPMLDRFDEGSLTRDDVKNQSFFLKFIYSTKKVTHKYYKHLVELLLAEGPTALADDMMVLGEIGKFEEVVDLMKKDIKKSVEKRGDVIFINLIDKKYSSIHVSLLQNEFINFKIFVLYKRDKKSVRVTLFDNNLVLDSRMYNLLSVAKKMNKDHSGGHMGGCGFTMPEGMTIEECTEKLSILIGELL